MLYHHLHLLQINLDFNFHDYKFALLSFFSAFVVTLITIPPIIQLVKKYSLYDVPDHRKEHKVPIATLGGVAIWTGMVIALLLWFTFSNQATIISFMFSLVILFSLGIMDDLKNLSAKYKLVIEIGLATIMAIAGTRISTFNGLFGIYELPLSAQYTFTVLAIVGITNAFNLIDGIDGLAGGLGFMSLVTLGIFLTLTGDTNMALIAFSLAGGLLAFLYYNFNPARIFMGDTGSLVLGFVVAIMCIRFMQVNNSAAHPIVPHAPVFVLGIVLIPVFDTLRVFSLRMWKGKSPFSPDKTHIHHLLTNSGFSHAFAAKLICVIHAFILMEVYWLKNFRQEWILFFLVLAMIVFVLALKHLSFLKKTQLPGKHYEDYELN
ncbi:MAG: undecaprenyl/decaprenyl-phosphate alpha-N-acetylglucosaminyl 1-phosphate transferase [Bacteroidetes bacterium]|nr:undecaprenyl/decaprenyl-phosphate alpha-N-acetylglucosaminyl 1-phosphate transferase [Bacteroidota bacterium]